MSEEIKYNRFCTIVEDNKEQQKGYPYITSKEVECSRFYSIGGQ